MSYDIQNLFRGRTPFDPSRIIQGSSSRIASGRRGPAMAVPRSMVRGSKIGVRTAIRTFVAKHSLLGVSPDLEGCTLPAADLWRICGAPLKLE